MTRFARRDFPAAGAGAPDVPGEPADRLITAAFLDCLGRPTGRTSSDSGIIAACAFRPVDYALCRCRTCGRRWRSCHGQQLARAKPFLASSWKHPDAPASRPGAQRVGRSADTGWHARLGDRWRHHPRRGRSLANVWRTPRAPRIRRCGAQPATGVDRPVGSERAILESVTLGTWPPRSFRNPSAHCREPRGLDELTPIPGRAAPCSTGSQPPDRASSWPGTSVLLFKVLGCRDEQVPRTGRFPLWL